MLPQSNAMLLLRIGGGCHNASDVGQPNTQSEPVAKKPRSRRLLIFVLGLVAGVASAVAWPRLGPIATCVQDIVQNEVPVPTESASDADWVKIYGEMKPVGKYDRLFSPTLISCWIFTLSTGVRPRRTRTDLRMRRMLIQRSWSNGSKGCANLKACVS
jgi:hypothetical protein